MALKPRVQATPPTKAVVDLPANKQSFIHIGDAHLRRGAWMSRPGLYGDSFHAFSRVIDFAIRYSLSIVSSGDLFNSTRPASDEIQFFNRQMKRIEEAGLKFYKIDGNHELANPSWSEVGLSSAVIDIDKKVVELLPGLFVYGLASRTLADLHTELPLIPKEATVLFCHQLMDWAINFSYSSNMDHRLVPPHVQLVLASDLHHAIEYTNPDTNQVFAYNGSMCMQNVAEPVEKSFMVVTYEGGKLRYDRVPLTGRPVFSAKVFTQAEFETVLLQVIDAVNPDKYGHLPAELRKPMVIVSAVTQVERAASRLEEAIGELGFLFFNSIDTQLTAPKAQIEPVSFSASDVLASLLNPTEHPAAYSLALALISNPDPRQTLATYREQQLGSVSSIPAPPK